MSARTTKSWRSKTDGRAARWNVITESLIPRWPALRSFISTSRTARAESPPLTADFAAEMNDQAVGSARAESPRSITERPHSITESRRSKRQRRSRSATGEQLSWSPALAEILPDG